VHTNLSNDSYPTGNKTLSPTDAYRFAQGESVQASNGQHAKLNRPLDFLVVADHAVSMGVIRDIDQQSSNLMRADWGKKLYQLFETSQGNLADGEDPIEQFYYANEWRNIYYEGRTEGYQNSIWSEVTASADQNNKPGKFTAFSGYEWSSNTSQPDKQSDGVGTFHRVIVFKDSADRVNQVVPFSIADSKKPEDLWQYLSAYVEKTGGDVLAIPHNPNLSYGRTFASDDSEGRPLDKAYAKLRSRWEPLLEVTQMKGDSETHPLLSPQDEFADFETWHSFNASKLENKFEDSYPEYFNKVMSPEIKRGEYARSALKQGLGHQATLSVNPFKFGMIGSTDSHTGLATADENYFWGKMGKEGPSPERMLKQKSTYLRIRGWEYAAAGYAGVWAEENTRESLFAAMKRKEVYATTGPRITVRFFGGWDYEADDALKPDLAAIGYEKGVPMGGDLTHAPNGKSPNFLIRVVKDPLGANLDRVQVIKGWRTKSGELQENVYDVSLSDSRKVRWNGKVKAVGNTVNVKDSSYINSIGDPELAVVWTDPDFNPDELAFYYLRAIEIPTPRWTAYDAKAFKIKDIPDEVPMVIQERAYSSPIWYSPRNHQK